jgi:hypothetical protein
MRIDDTRHTGDTVTTIEAVRERTIAVKNEDLTVKGMIASARNNIDATTLAQDKDTIEEASASQTASQGGILAKVNVMQMKADAYGRTGRTSLSNLHISVATLRDLRSQKKGHEGHIDEEQLRDDVQAMLRRHDVANGK